MSRVRASVLLWIGCAIAGSSCAAGDQAGENSFGPGLGGNSASNGGTSPAFDSGDDDGEGGDDGASSGDADPGTDDDATDPTTPTDSGDTMGGATSAGAACVGDGDCDDGDACTTDVCGPDGTCQATAVDCNDGVTCTTDTCDSSSGCANIPDPTSCDNADACDGVETCDATLGCQPGVPITCNDGDSCTTDVCNPADGSCGTTPVMACNAGDGCCPAGCSAVADSDCVCTNNGPSATGINSSGGSNTTGYGPSNWTDGVSEASCVAANCFECYGWVNNDVSASGQFVQLTWPAEQTIGSMFVETSNVGSGACAASLNRNVEDGTVQYWNGASWVNATTFTNQTGDLSFNFNPPLQTTQVRLFDVTATPNGDNSLIFEWYVYEPLDCTP